VDKQGQTIDCLLPEAWDEHAAKRFLTKAIRRHGVPEKITIEGSAAHEAAIRSDNQEHGTAIEIRQLTYLTKMVDQDHRGGKRITRPMCGFTSFDAAQATLVGIALMHMRRQGQLDDGVGQGLTTAEQCSTLAASSPHGQGQLPLQHLMPKICDRT
jgi:putative transposase